MPTSDQTHDGPAGVARLLRSPHFRRSRTAAVELMESPAALASLAAAARQHLTSLEARRELAEPDTAASILMAIGIVDSLADEEGHRGRPAHTEVGALDLARVRMVVAALHYFCTHHDLIGDHREHGLVDDIAIVRWALSPAAGTQAE